MRVHFIGTGERIMRDLATTLGKQGHTVTSGEGDVSGGRGPTAVTQPGDH